MQSEIDLSGLRDLHILPEPDFWPLAIGWWFVLGGVVFVLLCGVMGYRIWRERPVIYACRKVKKISKEMQDDLEFLKRIARLLRRVAIAADGREKVASLSDVKWQNFLMRRVRHCFTEDEAALIAFAPYEVTLTESVDRNVLVKHAFIWIKKIFKNKKSS